MANNENLCYVHKPLPYMEFSLEQVEQTALMSTKGAVLVNVPSPERYTLHKLLVHGVRAGASLRASASRTSRLVVMVISYATVLNNPWLAANRAGAGFGLVGIGVFLSVRQTNGAGELTGQVFGDNSAPAIFTMLPDGNSKDAQTTRQRMRVLEPRAAPRAGAAGAAASGGTR